MTDDYKYCIVNNNNNNVYVPKTITTILVIKLSVLLLILIHLGLPTNLYSPQLYLHSNV